MNNVDGSGAIFFVGSYLRYGDAFLCLRLDRPFAMLRLLVSACLLVLLHGPETTLAQGADTSSAISEACSAPEFRALDFWVGEWVVHDSTGKHVGDSRITRVARGCGIREEWAGTSGSRGNSINYYDAEDGNWHQDWVGSGGLILHLAGGVQEGAMVMEGERMGEKGVIRDRISWRALDDGRVCQEWTTSSDGGETWERVFLGFYEAASEESM